MMGTMMGYHQTHSILTSVVVQQLSVAASYQGTLRHLRSYLYVFHQQGFVEGGTYKGQQKIQEGVWG